MHRFRHFLAASLLIAACSDERPLDLPAEIRDLIPPDGWATSRGTPVSYSLGHDRLHQRNGSAAVYMGALGPAPTGFAVITQSLRADSYRGKRVRWSGWVRSTDVGGDGAGLWMRVDGPGVLLAFDNMQTRPLLGTADWQHVSVVLDVADNALGFALGVLLAGPGEIVVDDLVLEIVDTDVPTTDMLTEPTPSSVDSATTAASYELASGSPVNLDFEGLEPLSDATVDYLSRTAVAFGSVQPSASDADLEALRQMVGDARVVGMGEGTHGTREFFLLKHRVFQYLVRQLGFTHFAIEATWPEANDLNRYVLTGVGDPARLLSNLYFWTWNTQEVLDLIEWMREWNQDALPEHRVQFLGFDMQSPGAAIDTVLSVVEQVHAADVPYIADRFACLDGYRNVGPVHPQPPTPYAALPANTREACAEGLAQVYELVSSHSADYAMALSAPRADNALRSARLVQQYEEMISKEVTSQRGLARDAAMAENVLWLLEQAGPTTRMMLWAHNYHVSRRPGAMGDSLDRAMGADYVNLGFLFGRGRFNAVGTNVGLTSWSAQLVPANSLESLFLRTNEEQLLLDTRVIPASDPIASPLLGPILMRSIGAVFSPASESAYFSRHTFPRQHDLLMFVAETTPSVLLPFVN